MDGEKSFLQRYGIWLVGGAAVLLVLLSRSKGGQAQTALQSEQAQNQADLGQLQVQEAKQNLSFTQAMNALRLNEANIALGSFQASQNLVQEQNKTAAAIQTQIRTSLPKVSTRCPTGRPFLNPTTGRVECPPQRQRTSQTSLGVFDFLNRLLSIFTAPQSGGGSGTSGTGGPVLSGTPGIAG